MRISIWFALIILRHGNLPLYGKFFVINQRIDIALHGHASFNSVMRRVSLSFPWIYKCIIKFSYRNGSAHQGRP